MLYYATGSATTDLSSDDLAAILGEVFSQFSDRQKVLAIPPDITRFYSRAGEISCIAHDHFGERLKDILPALGTHKPMTEAELAKMYPSIPTSLFREHDWREGIETVGEVPSEFVKEVTEGIWDQPWSAQLNRLVSRGGHDLILSIGQVVPHEVIGMANYNKNLFVGCGGSKGINESHFIGAAYGMERMMGRADTPLRRIFNYASDNFTNHLPFLYILTVVAPREDGSLATRGLYIGDDTECFEQAAKLSAEVNFTQLEERPKKIVVFLEEGEFHSTWLGNKAVYRTRMAIADEGELVILAPAVGTFGEDAEIDRLIRKYGYRTTPEVMQFLKENEDLASNLSAAAHLIHGSSEGRFRITYCPGKLTRDEIEGVGYGYADCEEMLGRYNPEELTDGWNTLPDGERIFFISNPALGLWSAKS